MASHEIVFKVKEVVGLLLSLDRTKITRPELGVESLESIITPTLNELYEKTTVILKVADYVSNGTVQQVIDYLEAIIQLLAGLSAKSNQEFVADKAGVVSTLTSYIDAIRTVWPSFYIANQENFPQASQDILEATALTESIKDKVAIAEANLQSFQSMLEETSRIKDAAQNTAKGVSIQAAQLQFTSAQTNLKIKVVIAAIGAAIFLCWFFDMAFEFLHETQDLQDSWSWKIGYHASIRAIILGSIAAIATFFLSILKAYLHLLEHNLHRQRVANSTEAFVAAAASPEQRDLILGRLVDSVTTFGDSGLLRKESLDNSPLSKVSLDISSKIKE